MVSSVQGAPRIGPLKAHLSPKQALPPGDIFLQTDQTLHFSDSSLLELALKEEDQKLENVMNNIKLKKEKLQALQSIEKKGDKLEQNIVIVGAGPGGCFAALEAIEAGASAKAITLIESRGTAVRKNLAYVFDKAARRWLDLCDPSDLLDFGMAHRIQDIERCLRAQLKILGVTFKWDFAYVGRTNGLALIVPSNEWRLLDKSRIDDNAAAFAGVKGYEANVEKTVELKAHVTKTGTGTFHVTPLSYEIIVLAMGGTPDHAGSTGIKFVKITPENAELPKKWKNSETGDITELKWNKPFLPTTAIAVQTASIEGKCNPDEEKRAYLKSDDWGTTSNHLALDAIQPQPPDPPLSHCYTVIEIDSKDLYKDFDENKETHSNFLKLTRGKTLDVWVPQLVNALAKTVEAPEQTVLQRGDRLDAAMFSVEMSASNLVAAYESGKLVVASGDRTGSAYYMKGTGISNGASRAHDFWSQAMKPMINHGISSKETVAEIKKINEEMVGTIAEQTCQYAAEVYKVGQDKSTHQALAAWGKSKDCKDLVK